MKKRESTHSKTATNGSTTKMHSNGKSSDVHNGSVVKDDVTRERSFLFRLLTHTVFPLFLMAFAPNIVIVMWYTCVKCEGSYMVFLEKLMQEGPVTGLLQMWTETNLGSALAGYIILGYCAWALLLMIVLPGPRAEGPVTPKGNIPVYKDNGFFCYVVTVAGFAALTFYLKQHGMTPTIVYDHFGEFLGGLTIFSHLLCIFLTIKGLVAPSSTDSGSTGNIIMDYYWGTELYPRVFGIDIKVFTNCRFGMTVWPLLCLIFALKSYELHGFVDSMWVSCTIQMIYFTKFFWWESGYMRTIDIMMDRAGFYICWGCLSFIPGIYASVSLYLVNSPIILGPFWSVFILVCGSLSVAVNYLADWQKLKVRNTNCKCLIWGKKPEVIRAKYQLQDGGVRESLLLVSGYWGIARHFHYVPELALAFFWTVPALFENLTPYTYLISLIIILIHRTYRDDTKCAKKYTKYWAEYCKRVPYKMIPGIF